MIECLQKHAYNAYENFFAESFFKFMFIGVWNWSYFINNLRKF